MFNETYRYLLTHGIDFADILKPIWNKGGGWEKSNCKFFILIWDLIFNTLSLIRGN